MADKWLWSNALSKLSESALAHPHQFDIHGGGLDTGSGDLFDPSPLVEHGNLIVVTINYRIGFLGFFAHPAIDNEGHLNGNYGLMDQQFALEWVRRNIPAFGGNSQLVTLFGQSAGGLSTFCNLASPTAAGLFQRAIVESGSYAGFTNYLGEIAPLAVGRADTDNGMLKDATPACFACPQRVLGSLPLGDIDDHRGYEGRAIFCCRYSKKTCFAPDHLAIAPAIPLFNAARFALLRPRAE